MLVHLMFQEKPFRVFYLYYLQDIMLCHWAPIIVFVPQCYLYGTMSCHWPPGVAFVHQCYLQNAMPHLWSPDFVLFTSVIYGTLYNAIGHQVTYRFERTFFTIHFSFYQGFTGSR